MVSISQRLREERERLGLSQSDAADLTGQSRKSQGRYESGERSPDGVYLAKLASAGADILYILTGQRASPALQQAEAIERKHGLLIDRVNQVEGISEAARQRIAAELAEADFAHIPLHAALLAAGTGAENGTEEVVDYLAFRRDWLRRIGVAPGNAALARVDGDSMQPSIWHGDVVMIDRARIEVPVRALSAEHRLRSPVYALLDNGHARVKRIERPSEDQLVLISDNPDYGPQFCHPGEVTIIGKVVWWGHTDGERR